MLFLGIYSSFLDIKTKKIPNQLVGIVLVLGVALTFFYYHANHSYLLDYAINMLIGIGIAFVLWMKGFWPAGDAKLFFTYLSVIPLGYYSVGYLSFFPGYIVLVNTIVPLAAIMTVWSIKNLGAKKICKVIKNQLVPGRLIEKILFIFGFGWIIRMLFTQLLTPSLPMESMMLIDLPISLFVYSELQKLVKTRLSKYFLYLNIAFSFVRVVMMNFSLLDEAVLIPLGIQMFVFVFGYSLIVAINAFEFNKKVKIDNLAVGMEPLVFFKRKSGEKYWRAEPLIEKPDFDKIQDKKVELTKGTQFISCELNRYLVLNSKLLMVDVDMLKKYSLRNKLENNFLKIKDTIPLSPFLFIGAVLTLACNGNCLSLW